jgi:hypothetical protein
MSRHFQNVAACLKVPIERMIIYHLQPVSGLWMPDRVAVAGANLFFNKDMRLYLPLSVGLALKESHSAAGN